MSRIKLSLKRRVIIETGFVDLGHPGQRPLDAYRSGSVIRPPRYDLGGSLLSTTAKSFPTMAMPGIWLGIGLVSLATASLPASAQSAGSGASSQNAPQTPGAAGAPQPTLPPVTVEAPKERLRTAPMRTRPAKPVTQVKSVASKVRKQPLVAPAPRPPRQPITTTAVRRPSTQNSSPTAAARPIDPQSPNGPGVGFTATRTTTATKTDTPIMETPQSISVVTSDQIRDTGAQSVGQAIGYSAGVQTSPYGFDSRYDQFLIRGFTTDTVGLYQDGLREANAPFARFRNEPEDLDRIEILRGPASVLYGAGNPGGVVNLVSKTPVEQTFGNIGVDFGSYNEKQTRFDINTPVGTGGNVWFRVDGLFRDSNTQVPDTPDNRANISPALLFDFDGATTLTLLGNYAGNRNSMWPYYVPTAMDQVYDVRAGDPDFDALKQDQYSFGYKFEHHFNDVFTFRQNFRLGHVGFDGSFADQDSPLVPPQTIVPRYDGRFVDQLRSAEVDTNLQAKFSTGPLAHTLLAGVDYFHQSYNETFQEGAPAPTLDLLDPISLAGYGTGPITLPQAPILSTFQQIDQLGVYGQEQMVFGGLHVTVGGREDHATMTTDDLLAGTSVGSDADRFTGRTGALYLFDNGVAPYVSFSTSFLPIAGTTAEATPFKPTTGEQTEGGVKYAPPGWHSTFTASYFNIYQDNVLTADPNNPGFSIQTGEIRSRGVELEAVIGFARGLNGIASYSNTDARVIESTNIDLGKVPVAVPRNQAAFFLDYTIPYGRFAGIGGGGGVRYIGNTYADLGNTLENGAITAFDVQGHYDTGKIRFQVSVRNIADQRVAICNSGNCTFSQARIVLGSATARF